jgi:hypothetical protein
MQSPQKLKDTGFILLCRAIGIAIGAGLGFAYGNRAIGGLKSSLSAGSVALQTDGQAPK